MLYEVITRLHIRFGVPDHRIVLAFSRNKPSKVHALAVTPEIEPKRRYTPFCKKAGEFNVRRPIPRGLIEHENGRKLSGTGRNNFV